MGPEPASMVSRELLRILPGQRPSRSAQLDSCGAEEKGPVSGWLEVGLRAALPPSGQKQIERLMVTVLLET